MKLTWLRTGHPDCASSSTLESVGALTSNSSNHFHHKRPSLEPMADDDLFFHDAIDDTLEEEDTLVAPPSGPVKVQEVEMAIRGKRDNMSSNSSSSKSNSGPSSPSVSISDDI